MSDLTRIAQDMTRRARLLGSASALLWGGVRIRVEYTKGHWRVALARPVPPSMAQRKLVAAAFQLGDREWVAGNLVKVAGLTLWVVEVEWDEPVPVAKLRYVEQLQLLIGDVLGRWKGTGEEPPHPPSTIAGWAMAGYDCDWKSGEFHKTGDGMITARYPPTNLRQKGGDARN